MPLANLVTNFKIGCVVFVIFCLHIGSARAAPPTFNATVTPSTVGPGSTATVTFTITNVDATPVTSAGFTNTLPAGLVHGTPSDVTTTCANGALTAADGGTTLTFSGYDLAGSSSCTVTIDVLASTTAGVYTILTGDLTSSEGNSGSATANLTVVTNRPGYTMSFSPTSINRGAISTLTQTFDNTQNGARVGDLSSTVDLPLGLVIADEPNATSDCGSANAPVTITANAGASSVVFNADGSTFFPGFEALSAGASCTVTVDVKSTGVGTFTAVETDALADFNSMGGAKAAIVSTQAFALMEFEDNPTTPGATTNLKVTLTNFDRSGTATNIAFTDDLDAALSGLVATSLPAEPCGIGSSLSGTSTISLTGGSLAPEASCTFSVPVQIPAGAAASSNTNTTSTFTYDLDGSGVIKPAVSHNLTITQAPTISLSVTPDPVIVGNNITASFAINNIDTVQAATDIAFTSELTAFLPFPVTIPSFPTNPCGTGSSISLATPDIDTQVLSLTGGNLAAGASCNFNVDITVPSTMSPGNYTMTTEKISATINSATVTGGTTSDSFQIISAPTLSIEFDNTTLIPGGSNTATFTLSNNPNSPTDATTVAFTVDLDAALTGLTTTGFSSNTCAGSILSGTSIIDFSNGALAAGTSCSFNATLQLPGGGVSSNVNVTSSVINATVDGNAVTSPAVTSSFDVVTLTASMVVSDNDGDADNNVQPGSTTATIDFSFTNNSTLDQSAIGFGLDLNSALSGLVSSSGTLNNICGAGSSISGTNSLSFTNGQLSAGGSCNFSVTLTVPGAATDGDYTLLSNALSFTENSTLYALNPLTTNFNIETDTAPSIFSITSSVSPLTGVAPIPMEIVFSEDVEGFVDTDITVTNGTASNLVQVTADRYTFDITSPVDGTTIDVQLLAGVVEEAGAGTQTNTASSVFSIGYDTSALPTGIVTVPANVQVNTGPTTATVTYSNATIHSLTNDKVNLITTGTASTANFVDNNTPNPDITVINGTTATPTIQISNIVGDGTIAVGIDPLTARNNVGDVQAIADSTNSISVDNTAPTVAITSGVSDPTNSAFTINIDFTNPATSGPDTSITGFTSSDVILSNANISGFTGSGSSYSATITPTNNGNVTVDISSAVAFDDHGNGNVAAPQFSVTYDIEAPNGYAVAIDTPQPFINASNDTAFQFSYSGAEITSQYSYTITDGVNTSTPVTGTITTASGSFTGIDVSSFNEGTLTLSFTLTDVAGNTGGASTDTIIKQYNDAPVITEGATTNVVMSEDSTPTPFSLTLNATDPENETITWSVSSAASNGVASTSGDGTSKVINYTPNANFNGADSFTVEITDSNALDPLTDSIVVNVQVNPENDAPVFDSTSVNAVLEDAVYVYNIVTSDIDVGDNLAITATTIPSWLSLTSGANGTAVLTGTPLNEHVGNNSVTLVVTDDSGAANNSATQSFTIVVGNTNDAPTFDSTAITTGTEDANYIYNVTGSDVDLGDSISFSASVLPAWLSLTDNGNGTATLTGTPLNANVGNNNVTLVVTDSNSATDTQSFVIDVVNTNDLPTGLPVVTGTLLRNETLSVDTSLMSDDDGFGPFSYQWRRSGVNVTGATNSTYVLGEDDVWQTFSVIVSYTDLRGTNESLVSAESGTVSDLDSDGDGIFDLEEGTGDSDGDGIPDYLDEDSDNDGIPDSEEGNGDSDTDGIPDYLDTSLDEDGDGIPDALEGGANIDTDGDGTVDAFDSDSDNDGITDLEESGASGVDTDGDGIDDTFDVDATGGTDANGDGIDDNVALLDSDGDGIPDHLDRDSDNDSVPDALENRVGLQLKLSTETYKNTQMAVSDTDGDGVMDYLDPDSDEDGISDLAEAATSIIDSDMDQIIDEFDVDFTGGLDVDLDGVDDAAMLQNSDNDLTPDMFDLDADNDGHNDVTEAGLTDADLNALVDSAAERTDTPRDTDADGLADYRDLDSDNDGSFDIETSGAATLDLDGDGQVDDASADADGDGIIDALDDEPNQFGTSRDRDLDGVPSSVDRDDDGDGISDLVEGNQDSDGDGIIDSLDSDSDNDGLADMYEADRPMPSGNDVDRDGIDDRYDVDFTGGNDANADGVDDAFVNTDSDSDGTADYLDNDSDNDSISDSEEQLTVTLSGNDTDMDGLDDAVDVDSTNGTDSNGDGQDDSTISGDDIDGDGVLAFRDSDTDGDGISDINENGDFNGDGVNDRLQAVVEVRATSGGGSMGVVIILFLLLALAHRKKFTRKLVILFCAGSAFSAQAFENCDSDTGETCWYAELGVGRSHFDPVTENTSWDVSRDADTAYKFAVGFDFQNDWFAEFGYSRLGKAKLVSQNPAFSNNGFINYNATEAALGYRLKPSTGNYSFYFKAGLVALETNSNFIADDDDDATLLGFGFYWDKKDGRSLKLGFDQYGEDTYLVSLSLQNYF
ncbi:Ig-like domain-containing protein [Aliikangiella coralliicola]|uniref:Cadherin domain-containing protein n=1 Tax=Aliikangiella coralliicola TaxID=2592383 RepID=A0A545TSM0_9GAMM|nr:Ig-like domain-containing protein [Aliikangiella coralliicola]TQV80224.1 hypothetical protein FLL46_26255 [Aliikangiella coralliicola]